VNRLEALCNVLGDETRVCADLAAVLKNEQEAMVGLRAQALLACIEERQTLGEALLRLAAERRTLVAALAAERGTSADSVTALLPHLPPEPQVELRSRLRILRQALLETRRLERQNALLAGASEETVSELLRALAALAPGARYGADAQLDTRAALEQVDRHA
jgi:flagellar biosynthesis/type III secretory pathway chaperone